MPLRTLPGLLLILLALSTLAGCDPGQTATSMENWAGTSVNRLAYKRSTDKTIELDVARPIGIDVRSFAGDVVIEADEKLDHARVRVTRVATHGFGRGSEADASLALIRYDVELVPGMIGQVLQIRTATSHVEPNFQRANIHISVPEVDGVRVYTTLGRVHLTNIEGAVDVSTSFGDVRVMTNRPMTRPVSIATRQGNIDYRVRGESTAILDCETIGGRVVHRVYHGELRIHGGLNSDRLRATLNDGTNRVVLRTVDADIRIAVVHDPMHIGRWIVDP